MNYLGEQVWPKPHDAEWTISLFHVGLDKAPQAASQDWPKPQ